MKTSYCQDVLFSLYSTILQEKADTAPNEYYCKTVTGGIDNTCYGIHSEYIKLWTNSIQKM